MPKVSVIIPTCNRAAYLKCAIDSVLAQTFNDFEIIVVDDASSDDTHEVVAGYRDRRINYIRHDSNRGGSAARNTGIMRSQSRYVAFLDDDDEWLPKKLEKQVALLERSSRSTGVVYTACYIVDAASGANLRVRAATKRGNLLNELLVHNCIGGTPSVIMRRECFERVGLFDEELPSFQDYDLWMRVAREYEFDCISEPLAKLYFHGEKKIWTNLEAISQGIGIMLKKHGFVRSLRPWFSQQYSSIGAKYCQNGNATEGRRAYLKAIEMRPFDLRHYRNLSLSFLSVRSRSVLREMRRKLAWGINSRC